VNSFADGKKVPTAWVLIKYVLPLILYFQQENVSNIRIDAQREKKWDLDLDICQIQEGTVESFEVC